MESRSTEAERKRVQKIRKRANQSFLDFHNIDRNDPHFMQKYTAALKKRDEERALKIVVDTNSLY